MNIVVMDNKEKFLSFVNPKYIDVVETFENGLRRVKVEYNIQNLLEAQTYFKLGNKIWISGNGNLTPCLYVINTSVKQDLFKENTFTFDAEEVLVELNYAPYFSQSELTSDNGFTVTNNNGEKLTTINYNALKYLFGDYLNIGVIQDCISAYTAKISINGIQNRMSLLRYIEEETGNIFVTRYEKDINTNVIHRYLDFLNPISQNKNWECNFEYDFLTGDDIAEMYDSNGNPTEVTEYEEEPVVFIDADTITNLTPANTQFRITNTNGEVISYVEDGTTKYLRWSAVDCGLSVENKHVVIRLTNKSGVLGIKVHNKTYKVLTDVETGSREINFRATDDDPTQVHNALLPNGSYFEFYDTSTNKVVYRRNINPILNEAHSEILDLGFNVENVEFDTDESDTFSAITPVLSLTNNTGASNELSFSDMGKIAKAWRDLTITKGQVIPMIVQKLAITGTDNNPCTQRTGTATSPNRSAEQILGAYNLSSNYYSRPYKPSDTTDQTNKSYEYWVGTAYWKAPFTKNAGELHVEVESNNSLDYPDIRCRPDSRESRGVANTPKMGSVETSEENVYAIYNAVAMKLKEKKDPQFDVTVDVANFRDHKFNNYGIHDKVYIKLPSIETLVTAVVTKTEKYLHDIAKNKVTLGNYSINTKEITKETHIEASNINFKYPNSKKLTVKLKDSTDDNAKLSGKLLSFTLYKVDNGSATLTKKHYTAKTNSNGQASINCKYNPGDYEIDIQFSGDAEYSECATTVEVSVGGVKKVKTNTKDNKSTSKYKTVNEYYDKYGRSPDKKTVMAIGLPSRSSEVNKYGYRFMKTVFKNKCPGCGQQSLYWGWNFGTYFRGRREGGSVEGHLFCDNPRCDMDFSGINGENHNGSGRPKVQRVKAPVKSSKAEAKKLINGKMLYGTKQVKIKQKDNVDKKSRRMKGSVNSYVKNKALSIVGNSTSYTAMKKIASWMDKNIHYAGYGNFQRSAKTCLQRGSANCCDGTRLFFELCDAAGITEWYKFEYIHVYGHVYAKVTNKDNGHYWWVDSASDVHGMWSYICIDYRGRGIIHQTEYPRLPF